MRLVICYMSLLAIGSALVGCGQSGALQLPSDPNYDKRAKYLLYPNVDSKSHAEQNVSEQNVPTETNTESNQPSTP